MPPWCRACGPGDDPARKQAVLAWCYVDGYRLGVGDIYPVTCLQRPDEILHLLRLHLDDVLRAVSLLELDGVRARIDAQDRHHNGDRGAGSATRIAPLRVPVRKVSGGRVANLDVTLGHLRRNSLKVGDVNLVARVYAVELNVTAYKDGPFLAVGADQVYRALVGIDRLHRRGDGLGLTDHRRGPLCPCVTAGDCGHSEGHTESGGEAHCRHGAFPCGLNRLAAGYAFFALRNHKTKGQGTGA